MSSLAKAIHRSALVFLLGALMVGCFNRNARGAAHPFLRQIADIPLPGGATRFDYQSLDPTTGRLYLSHMGDGKLVVFDTRRNKPVTSLAGFPGVTGVLAMPALKEVYASVTGNHEIAVVNTQTLSVEKRIADGRFPDGIAYAPETQKIFVSDEMGCVETVIDTKTNQRVETIPMRGEVGNTQYDPISKRIYACVQTENELVSIDPATDKIEARFFLKGGRHPHGLYIDAERAKAYIACDGNNRLLVFDLKSHAIEQDLPAGEDPDVLAFDPGLKILYVACESGEVSIFKVVNGTLKDLGNFDIGPNSHSVAVDPRTHRVFFPLKNLNGRPVLRIMLPMGAAGP